jgi:hypothetical protein
MKFWTSVPGSLAICGTIWMPEEPLPMTAMRLLE